MRNRHWMALVMVASMGLAACGGDANGDGAMDDAGAAMEEAADDAAAAAEDMGDAAANAAGEAGSAMGDMAQELPEGVTMAMVAEGDSVFHGAGICQTCHGPAGEGLPQLGANLTDDEWLHADGTYESIVQTIMSGVTADESTSGVPMPARGGTTITDDQVRAAAAYVWTLSK